MTNLSKEQKTTRQEELKVKFIIQYEYNKIKRKCLSLGKIIMPMSSWTKGNGYQSDHLNVWTLSYLQTLLSKPKNSPSPHGASIRLFRRLPESLARGADCNGLRWLNYPKYIAIETGTLITLLPFLILEFHTKPAILLGLQEAPAWLLEKNKETKEEFRVSSVFCMRRELTTERSHVQTHLPYISTLIKVNSAPQLMSYSSFIHFGVIKSTKVH